MATPIHTTIPYRFHNLSPAMLADLIGELDRRSKDAEAELKAAKDAFKSLGLTTAQGDAYAIMQTSAIRQTLDTAMVKADMGQQWFDDHSKLAEVVTLRITAAKSLALAA